MTTYAELERMATALQRYDFNRHPLLRGINPRRNKVLRLFRRVLSEYEGEKVILEGFAGYGDYANLKIVAALGLMIGAELDGRLTGIEELDVPSSGNTAYGVALIAPAWPQLKAVNLYLKKDTVPSKVDLLDAFAITEVVKVRTGQGMKTPIEVAFDESQAAGHLFVNQYADAWQLAAQYAWTGGALLRAIDQARIEESENGEDCGELSAVVAMSGTKGTIGGVGARYKQSYPKVRVVQGVNAPGHEIPGSREDAHILRDVSIEPPAGTIDDKLEALAPDAFDAMVKIGSEVAAPPGPSGCAGENVARAWLKQEKERDNFASVRNSMGFVRVGVIWHDSHLLYTERGTGRTNYEKSVVLP